MNCCYGLVNEEWKKRKKINEREENKERLQKKTPKYIIQYRKVASSRLSWLVAHFHISRLFMKGKFDAFVL